MLCQWLEDLTKVLFKDCKITNISLTKSLPSFSLKMKPKINYITLLPLVDMNNISVLMIFPKENKVSKHSMDPKIKKNTGYYK